MTAPSGPTASTKDVELAVNPIRWLMLDEAVSRGGFPATRAIEIARRSTRFKGKDPAARDHARRLVEAGLLSSRREGSSVVYRPTDKGRLVHGHVVALAAGAAPDDVRTPAESRVVALVARLNGADDDAFGSGGDAQYELVAALTDGVRTLADTRARVTVTPIEDYD